MPSSKSATPTIPPDHALGVLSIGTVEEITALAKLTPVTLPNDLLVASLRESHPRDPRWRSFRNDPGYLYVNNWLFQCRGYIKLASEHFDVDLFEIELFDLVQPPPVDDMALLINKVKLALISKVHGKRVSSVAMFETLFRVYFGSETALSGPSQEDEEVSETGATGVYPAFDDLFIDEKYSVLAVLIAEISTYPDFREYLEKNKTQPDSLRISSVAKIATREKFRREEYVSLFDGTALYKRTVTVPDLVIPKKRKLAPQHPELHFPEEVFDVASVEYELVYKDIYGLDLFAKELFKNKRLKLNFTLLEVISTSDYVSNVYAYESRKRKIISGRKKEFEMARLLATRKRSSRIEAKEKQKHLEEKEKKAQELEDLQYATARRLQINRTQITRSQGAHRQFHSNMDYTEGLSRGDRLSLRKEKVEKVEVPEPSEPSITVNAGKSSEPDSDQLVASTSTEPEVIDIEDDDSLVESAAQSSATSPLQTPKVNGVHSA